MGFPALFLLCLVAIAARADNFMSFEVMNNLRRDVPMAGAEAVACPDVKGLETHQLGPCMALGLVGTKKKDGRDVIVAIGLAHVTPIADVPKVVDGLLDRMWEEGATDVRAIVGGGFDPSIGSPDLHERISKALVRNRVPEKTVEGFTDRHTPKRDRFPPFISVYLGCNGTMSAEIDQRAERFAEEPPGKKGAGRHD